MTQELIDKGIEIFGTEELFNKWLNSPIPSLGGEKPKDQDEATIFTILGRIEWGVY